MNTTQNNVKKRKKQPRGKCAVCRTPIPWGATHCRDHKVDEETVRFNALLRKLRPPLTTGPLAC